MKPFIDFLTNIFSNPWILAGMFVLGGIVFGLLVEFIVLSRLRSISAHTTWVWDDILVNALRRIILLAFILAGISLAISCLPYTEEIIGRWQKIIKVLIVIVFTVFFARLAKGLVSSYNKKAGGALPATSILTNLSTMVILIFGVLVALQSVGISVTPILTALGIGGLAVALALQDTLSNLFSGLQILLAKQIRPGDYIKLDSGETGLVTDITWRNTTIQAIANNIFVIPNSKMANTIVTNYNLPEKELSVIVEMSVSYTCDLQKVEKVVIETAKQLLQSSMLSVAAFEPVVRFHTFADSGINFSVVLRAKEFPNQFLLKHEFIKAIHERFKKENIEIPFPQRVVHMVSS